MLLKNFSDRLLVPVIEVIVAKITKAAADIVINLLDIRSHIWRRELHKRATFLLQVREYRMVIMTWTVVELQIRLKIAVAEHFAKMAKIHLEKELETSYAFRVI